MNDAEIKYFFRDRRVDMEAILDHLSLCLLIVNNYQSHRLRNLIEQAIYRAQTEFDDVNGRKLN